MTGFPTEMNIISFIFSMNSSLLSTEGKEAKNKLSKCLGILSKTKKNRSIRVFFYNRCFSLTLNLFSDMTLKNRQPQ